MPDPKNDLGEDLSQVWDDLEKAEQEAAGEPPAPAADSADEQPQGEPAPEGEQAEAAAEGEQPEAPAAAEDEEPAPEGEQPGEPEEPALEAPSHWPEKRRQLFDSVTADVQRDWLEREAEYERGVNQKAEQTRAYREVLAPLHPVLEFSGVDELSALRQMVGYTVEIQRGNAASVIRHVAKQHGVNLADLAQQNGLDDEDDDPRVKALRDDLDSIKGKLSQSERQEAERAHANRMAEIQAFQDATDESGKPKYPLAASGSPQANQTLQAMARIAAGYVQSGQVAPPLDQLYDEATWADRQLRAEVQRASTVQTAQKAEAAARQKAASAKRAAGVPSAGSAPGSPGQRSVGSVREDLEAAADELGISF